MQKMLTVIQNNRVLYDYVLAVVGFLQQII